MIDYIAFLSRVVLVLVLFAAVFGKVSHRQQFMTNLQESFGIPQALILPAFVTLVLAEGILCLGLIFDEGLLKATFVAITFMFTVMTVTLLVMLLQNKVFKCACFGEPQHNANFGDVIRNGVLILASASGVFAGQSALVLPEQLLTVMMAVPLSFLIVHFSELYPVLKWSKKQ